MLVAGVSSESAGENTPEEMDFDLLETGVAVELEIFLFLEAGVLKEGAGGSCSP